MNKIRIITDSSCDLNKDIIEKYNIKVVPLNVSFGDEIYMDSELDNKEFYEKMKGEEMDSKSQEIIEELLEEDDLYDAH